VLRVSNVRQLQVSFGSHWTNRCTWSSAISNRRPTLSVPVERFFDCNSPNGCTDSQDSHGRVATTNHSVGVSVMSEAQRSSSLSDEQVLQRARSAENGRKFRLRFDRQYDDSTLQERYATRFKAEVALLANLAFWTGRDTEQMWRLFFRTVPLRTRVVSWVPPCAVGRGNGPR